MNKHPKRSLAVGLVLAASSTLAGAASSWTDPVSGAEFIQAPAGCFTMGADKAGGVAHERYPLPPNADELPRHEVCVDAFWIGRHEVTRGQWRKVMGEEPPRRGSDNQPVSHMSRADALRYLERLNASSRDGSRFRLPTEAEWEYACRAGREEVYASDHTPEVIEALQATAWYSYSELTLDDAQTKPVGTKSPNAWGIHDMLGNVAEWVADAYESDAYARHAKRNPSLTKRDGDRYVLRGGNYKSEWWNVRCSVRSYGLDGDPLYVAGMRVVRTTAPAR